MRRRTSIKLFSAFGIRVGADASFFVGLFVLILLLSPRFRDTLHSSDGAAYVTAVASALLLFASLLVHEFGHALAARREGIGAQNIDLFLLGGLTRMSRDAETPGEEFRVAAAGPAATLLVTIVCLGIDLAIVGPNRLWHAVLLDGSVKVTPVLMSLSWLLLMNVIVFIFNLVPAFPLDGGRIIRALVWHRTADKVRGTRAAAKLGQGFAALLAGVGIWWILASGGSIGGGLWLIAISFLIGQAARGALLQTALTERIEGVRVADIMDRQPVAIPSETPVTQALDEYFLRYGWSWFPVVDRDGRFMGVVRQPRAQVAHDGGEGWLTVGAVVEAEEAGSWRVNEDRPLTELLGSEPLGRLGALMAVDANGVLRGVVTIDQVRRALQSAFAPPAA
jgi:Zn-dependent protease/CBS domain-containing protein